MRYRLTAGLEGGTLAELYSAVADERLPVLVKLFFPHTSDRDYAREVARIAQRVNALSAPGLVRVWEVGMIQDRLALVRDWVDGVSLAQLLHRLSRRELFLSPTLCFSVIVDLLDRVQHLHDAGIVHGSLTPGNLFVTQAGSVAICDFGALQAVRSTPPLARLFATGGRSGYRAPEVLLGDLPTEASDLYSLAAVAYELLTLREPRPEGTDPLHSAVLPPSRVDRRLAPRVDALLGRALDPSPLRRYASCADFAGALRDLIGREGGVASVEERQRLASAIPPSAPLLPLPYEETFQLTDTVSVEGRVEPGLPAPRPFRSGGVGPAGAAALAHPDGNPDDDETDPEPTAPTASWHAPPGLMRGLRRRLLGQASASRRVRVRWVRDFESGEDTTVDPTDPPSAAVIPVRFPQRSSDSRRGAPHPRRDRGGRELPSQGIVGRWGLRFLVGTAMIAGGIWLGRSQRGDQILTVLVPLWSRTPPLAPAAPPLATPAVKTPVLEAMHDEESGAAPADLGWDSPPPAKTAGFLSVGTNLPARVYLDGALIRYPTPLDRYPVRPGTHKLVLEAVGTSERREVTVTVQRGKAQTVRQLFEPVRPAR